MLHLLFLAYLIILALKSEMPKEALGKLFYFVYFWVTIDYVLSNIYCLFSNKDTTKKMETNALKVTVFLVCFTILVNSWRIMFNIKEEHFIYSHIFVLAVIFTMYYFVKVKIRIIMEK